MSAFNVAMRLAPQPDSRLDEFGETRIADWTRHYAAIALAANAEFKDSLPPLGVTPAPGSRPDLGHLMLIATSATAAVIAMSERNRIGAALWDLTPECGALNGEYIDYLANALDDLGVNPADIFTDFDAADFTSPPAGSTPGETA